MKLGHREDNGSIRQNSTQSIIAVNHRQIKVRKVKVNKTGSFGSHHPTLQAPRSTAAVDYLVQYPRQPEQEIADKDPGGDEGDTVDGQPILFFTHPLPSVRRDTF